MNKKNENLEVLEETGLIAIIRAKSSEDLKKVVFAIKEGGAKFIEVTVTTPDALNLIEDISKNLKDVIIGAGSVLDTETARASILKGAEFIVCPTLNKEVIKLCNCYSKIVIPGAFTPTEILTGWEYGADLIKVFPSSIGGPSYIKAIKSPLPQIELVPVGGVSIENVADFIKAGSFAVAVGSELVKKQFLENKEFSEIGELTKKFIEEIKKAKKK